MRHWGAQGSATRTRATRGRHRRRALRGCRVAGAWRLRSGEFADAIGSNAGWLTDVRSRRRRNSTKLHVRNEILQMAREARGPVRCEPPRTQVKAGPRASELRSPPRARRRLPRARHRQARAPLACRRARSRRWLGRSPRSAARSTPTTWPTPTRGSTRASPSRAARSALCAFRSGSPVSSRLSGGPARRWPHDLSTSTWRAAPTSAKSRRPRSWRPSAAGSSSPRGTPRPSAAPAAAASRPSGSR